MKVVLDTNVLVSARNFGGKPEIIVDLIIIERKLEGVTSPFLLDEYYRVLRERFHYDTSMLRRIDRTMRDNFTIITPKTIPDILTDKPDNNVLAVAHATSVDAVITGDNLILSLKEYKSVPILTPDAFLKKHHFDTTEENCFYDDLLKQ